MLCTKRVYRRRVYYYYLHFIGSVSVSTFVDIVSVFTLADVVSVSTCRHPLVVFCEFVVVVDSVYELRSEET